MGQRESLIGLEEAAQLLGYSVSGLRKIINRSRRKIRGEPAVGPTIRFFQAGPKAPIKFKPVWIEDFICQHTGDPSRIVPAAQPRTANPSGDTKRRTGPAGHW